MKAFVTGGTGLVGIHLILDLLKRDYDVVALCRKSSSTKHVQAIFQHYNHTELFDKIEWVDGDVTEIFSLIDNMKGCDVVYHSAAVVSFTGTNLEDMYKINIDGTATVVDACLDVGIKRLGYVSSTAAIGKNEKQKEVREDDPWIEDDHVSSYSISKHQAEREVWRGIEEGLEACIVNPCVIVGPGKWGQSSTSLIETVDNGFPFYSSGANAFVDVRDVSEALIQFMEKDIINERTLVIGENMTYRNFFTQVAEKLDKKPPHIPAKPWMGAIAWRMEWIKQKLTGKNAAVTKETAKSAYQTTVYNREKIFRLIPDFKYHSIPEAVENTVSAFQKR